MLSHEPEGPLPSDPKDEDSERAAVRSARKDSAAAPTAARSSALNLLKVDKTDGALARSGTGAGVKVDRRMSCSDVLGIGAHGGSRQTL